MQLGSFEARLWEQAIGVLGQGTQRQGSHVGELSAAAAEGWLCVLVVWLPKPTTWDEARSVEPVKHREDVEPPREKKSNQSPPKKSAFATVNECRGRVTSRLG